MNVQEVVDLTLYEVADILVYALAAGSHLQRAELDLGLALKHGLLHVYGYGSHQTVAYVAKLVVFVEKLLDCSRYVFLEGTLVCASLCGVLSVYERVIFLAILVGVCERYLYVLALGVDDGIESVGGHGVVEKVYQTVARQDAPSVIHDGEARVEVGIVAQHGLHDVVVEAVANEQCVVGLEEDVGTVLVVGLLGGVALEDAALEGQCAHLAVAERFHLEVR